MTTSLVNGKMEPSFGIQLIQTSQLRAKVKMSIIKKKCWNRSGKLTMLTGMGPPAPLGYGYGDTRYPILKEDVCGVGSVLPKNIIIATVSLHENIRSGNDKIH